MQFMNTEDTKLNTEIQTSIECWAIGITTGLIIHAVNSTVQYMAGIHTSALVAHTQLEINVLLSMQISYHALSIPLELSGNGLEGLKGLKWSWFPLGQLLVNSPCQFFCIVLCCACLQKPGQECLYQRSAALPPYDPPFHSHPVLSHTVITNCPWLAPQVSGYWSLRHIH